MDPCQQEPEIKNIQKELGNLSGVVSSMEQSHKELVILLKKVTEQGVEIRHVLEQQAVLFKQLSFMRDERLPAIDAGFAGFKSDINQRFNDHKTAVSTDYLKCKADIDKKISDLKLAPGKWILAVVQAVIIAIVGAGLVSLITIDSPTKAAIQADVQHDKVILRMMEQQQKTIDAIQKALDKRN